MPLRVFTRRQDDISSLDAWRDAHEIADEALAEYRADPSELNRARLRGALFIETACAETVAAELAA